MAINTNLLYKAVKEVLVTANTYSSVKLSEIRTGKPSIGRYGAGVPSFDFPYALIEVGINRPAGGYLTNKYADNDNGNLLTYETNREFLIRVRVYADKGESYDIASNFEMAFSFDSSRSQIQTTAKATVHSTESVIPLPNVLEDDFNTEYNQFNVILSVQDKYVDNTSVTLGKVNVVPAYLPSS